MVEIGFETTGRKGFHITFENGWTVSVQFGYGNYGSNRDWKGSDPADVATRFNDQAPKAAKAEIAAWDVNNKWYEFEGDSVDGYQSPAQVLAFMNMIAAFPASEVENKP